ncbi:WD40 repeat-like protein [Rhizopogon salebrosus TDB-379]|nr:WD40 repeat-like protein [Rhizopogon salebrosus TDB-379]
MFLVAIPGKTMSLPAAVTEETHAMRPCRKFEGHTKPVSCVIHLPGEQQIMTCSYDGSLQVWDLQSGKRIRNDWRDEESDVNTIALSLDGKKVASGSDDGAVRLWDIDTRKVIAKWTGHKGRISSVCWNRDQGGRVMSGSYDDGTKLLATGCDDNNAYSWDISAIAKGAGFSDLLNSNPNHTQRPGDWRRNPYPGPPNDSPHHHHPARHNITTSSERQQYDSAHLSSRQYALPRRTQPSRRNNYHTEDIPNQSRFLKWTRNSFSHTRNSRIDEGIELHECPPEGADVSLRQATPRYYSQKGAEMEKEKAHHSQPNTDEPTGLQQQLTPSIPSHDGRHVVEVAAVRDRETLYVAQRPERTSDQAERIGKLKWWKRCILFICCTHIPDTNGPQ